ncbi:uncharacterized protein [Oryctolagus cuniculus]|uniref:uncharacterized protein isoform X3 n=1 Tax=Oryctolagus cuniculus TaxID=9986 RepID=UPI00387912A6
MLIGCVNVPISLARGALRMRFPSDRRHSPLPALFLVVAPGGSALPLCEPPSLASLPSSQDDQTPHSWTVISHVAKCQLPSEVHGTTKYLTYVTFHSASESNL